MIEHHWLVSWNLPDGQTYSSEVLRGAGSALSTKFRPGGFRSFVTGPVSALTNRLLELGDLFGADGTRLEQRCLALPRPADALVGRTPVQYEREGRERTRPRAVL